MATEEEIREFLGEEEYERPVPELGSRMAKSYIKYRFGTEREKESAILEANERMVRKYGQKNVELVRDKEDRPVDVIIHQPQVTGRVPDPPSIRQMMPEQRDAFWRQTYGEMQTRDEPVQLQVDDRGMATGVLFIKGGSKSVFQFDTDTLEKLERAVTRELLKKADLSRSNLKDAPRLLAGLKMSKEGRISSLEETQGTPNVHPIKVGGRVVNALTRDENGNWAIADPEATPGQLLAQYASTMLAGPVVGPLLPGREARGDVEDVATEIIETAPGAIGSVAGGIVGGPGGAMAGGAIGDALGSVAANVADVATPGRSNIPTGMRALRGVANVVTGAAAEGVTGLVGKAGQQLDPGLRLSRLIAAEEAAGATTKEEVRSRLLRKGIDLAEDRRELEKFLNTTFSFDQLVGNRSAQMAADSMRNKTGVAGIWEINDLNRLIDLTESTEHRLDLLFGKPLGPSRTGKLAAGTIDAFFAHGDSVQIQSFGKALDMVDLATKKQRQYTVGKTLASLDAMIENARGVQQPVYDQLVSFKKTLLDDFRTPSGDIMLNGREFSNTMKKLSAAKGANSGWTRRLLGDMYDDIAANVERMAADPRLKNAGRAIEKMRNARVAYKQWNDTKRDLLENGIIKKLSGEHVDRLSKMPDWILSDSATPEEVATLMSTLSQHGREGVDVANAVRRQTLERILQKSVLTEMKAPGARISARKLAGQAPATELKVRALIGDDLYDSTWSKFIEGANVLKGMEATMANSQTFRLQEAAETASDVLTGGPLKGAGRIANILAARQLSLAWNNKAARDIMVGLASPTFRYEPVAAARMISHLTALIAAEDKWESLLPEADEEIPENE